MIIEHSPISHSFTKMATSMIGGGILTALAFMFMTHLISQEQPRIKVTDTPVVEILFNEPDTQVKHIKRLPPPPPKPEAQPPKPQQTVDSETIDNIGVPGPNLGLLTMAKPTLTPMTIKEGDAAPLVRIDPKYPTKAAREGIEGWVKLAFSISESGTIINASVIDAQPKRVFNRAALKALKGWKYRPKIQDGKPVIQTGKEIMLEFSLEQS